MRLIFLFLVVVACLTFFVGRPLAASTEGGFVWPENLPAPVDQALLAQERRIHEDVAGLSESDLLTRNQAFDRIKLYRQQAVEQLVGLVSSADVAASFGGPLHRAMVLLGDYRAVEAVPSLAERLTYLPDGQAMEFTGEDRESYYPAAQALAQIGEPSIPAMVAASILPDELARRLALWVIIRVEGKDQAAHRFETLAQKTSDPQFRERYEAAKQYILSYEPDRTSPYIPPPAKAGQAGSEGTDSGGEK